MQLPWSSPDMQDKTWCLAMGRRHRIKEAVRKRQDRNLISESDEPRMILSGGLRWKAADLSIMRAAAAISVYETTLPHRHYSALFFPQIKHQTKTTLKTFMWYRGSISWSWIKLSFVWIKLNHLNVMHYERHLFHISLLKKTIVNQ